MLTHGRKLKDDEEGLLELFTGISLLTVSRVRLNATSKSTIYLDCDAREGCLLVLTGTGVAQVSGPWGKRTFANIGERRDVFSGLPTAITVKAFSRLTLEATSRYLDCVWATAPTSGGPELPSCIRPQDVQLHHIGKDYHYRTVREVVGGHGITENLRVGETISPPGLWSSWPNHDYASHPEVAKEFEEVFLYFTDPPTGYGLQVRRGVLSDGEPIDDIFTFINGDSAVLPLGHTPVVAGPESSVLYVWVYQSPIPKKYGHWAESAGGYA